MPGQTAPLGSLTIQPHAQSSNVSKTGSQSQRCVYWKLSYQTTTRVRHTNQDTTGHGKKWPGSDFYHPDTRTAQKEQLKLYRDCNYM